MIQITNTNQNVLKNMISMSKKESIADRVYPKMLVSSKIAAKREKTNRDINGNAQNPKSSKYFFLVLLLSMVELLFSFLYEIFVMNNLIRSRSV